MLHGKLACCAAATVQSNLRYASWAIMRSLSDGVTCNMTAWLSLWLQSDD